MTTAHTIAAAATSAWYGVWNRGCTASRAVGSSWRRAIDSAVRLIPANSESRTPAAPTLAHLDDRRQLGPFAGFDDVGERCRRIRQRDRPDRQQGRAEYDGVDDDHDSEGEENGSGDGRLGVAYLFAEAGKAGVARAKNSSPPERSTPHRPLGRSPVMLSALAAPPRMPAATISISDVTTTATMTRVSRAVFWTPR